MKQLQKTIVALIVTALLLPTTLLAQSPKSAEPPDNWNALASIPPGSEISLALKRGLTINGSFVSADEDFIFVRELKLVSFYHRVNVKSVSVLIARTKAADAATAAGLGFVAGYKHSLEPKLKNNGRCCRYSSIGTTAKSAVAGAAMGGLLGLLFGGNSEERLIYAAK